MSESEAILTTPARPSAGRDRLSAPCSQPRARAWSLRLRIGGWTVAVFTLALTLSTIVGIAEDRQQLLAAQAEQGRALLTHLSLMGEFQGGVETAVSHLSALRDSLVGSGGSLELVPAAKPAENDVVARQTLSLATGTFELRYVGNAARLRALTRRSVLLHVAHGVLTLAILLAGMEWILRRNLIAPLRSLSHQVDRMRHGGGWAPVIPPTDVELGGLAEAVRGLGPALEEQVHQWVNAERRSAVALALNHIRAGLRGSLRDAQALIGDLQARRLVAPSGTPKLRSILGNLDRIREVLQIEEEVEAAHTRWAGPAPGDASSRT
jgi:hypothetical protein